VNAPESTINNLMGLVEPMQLMPLPPGVWIAIALAVLMAIVMRQTVFGRHVFAIGSNEATARLCGIRVQYRNYSFTWGGLVLWAGRFDADVRLTQGDPTVAMGLELDVIAAVVIGGASLVAAAAAFLVR
jgi:ribose transport system permease protein